MKLTRVNKCFILLNYTEIKKINKLCLTTVSTDEVARLNENLDFLNVRTMNFFTHQSDPDRANHHAPLFGSTWIHLTADFAINSWIEKGISPNKILLGIPLHGQSWILTSDKITSPAPATGAGAPGKFTTQAGMMAYYEICDAVHFAGWTEIQDPSGNMGPYAVSPNKPKTWIGYDDPAMAVVKSKYVLSKGLGGVSVWSIDMDDFWNICGGGVNPMLTAISRTLKGQLYVPTSTSTETNKGTPRSPPINSTISSEEIGFCECICEDPM